MRKLTCGFPELESAQTNAIANSPGRLECQNGNAGGFVGKRSSEHWIVERIVSQIGRLMAFSLPIMAVEKGTPKFLSPLRGSLLMGFAELVRMSPTGRPAAAGTGRLTRYCLASLPVDLL
jgi:hypothetical protein